MAEKFAYPQWYTDADQAAVPAPAEAGPAEPEAGAGYWDCTGYQPEPEAG